MLPHYTYIIQPLVPVAGEVYHYQSPREKNCFSRVEMNVGKCCGWAGKAQSVQRLSEGWTVREIESRWRRGCLNLSRPALGPLSLLYNGYLIFTGGK